MPFYLKNNKTLYFRFFPVRNDELVYYFGISINPKQWSKKYQKVMSTHPQAEQINTLLRNIQTVADNAKLQSKIEGVRLTSERLRSVLDDSINGVPESSITLKEYIQHFLKSRAPVIKASSLIAYRSKLNMIMKHYPQLDWNKITPAWRHRAYNELSEIYGHNNISKLLSVLRTVILAAVEEGITDIKLNAGFVPPPTATESVYLDKEQVAALQSYKYDMDHHYNAVRLWLLLYTTGQRVSDLDKVMNGVIMYVRGVKLIRFQQTKTGTFVSIPVTPVLDELLTVKPRIISDQKLNKYIKEAATIAGITVADQITTHTARRSCATNLVLEGFPLQMVRDITGHKTESELMKYIRYNDVQAAIKVSEHEKFNQLYKDLINMK